jgi:hypothetical protein
MRALCLELIERIPELLLELDAVAAEEALSPGAPDARPHEFGQALATMFDWALCPDRREPGRAEQRRGAVAAAAEHGRARRVRGDGDVTILRDYYLARVVVGRAVARLVALEGDVMEAMASIDGAISVTTRAALIGYHAPELEARGAWPSRLHELCDDAATAGRVAMD